MNQTLMTILGFVVSIIVAIIGTYGVTTKMNQNAVQQQTTDISPVLENKVTIHLGDREVAAVLADEDNKVYELVQPDDAPLSQPGDEESYEKGFQDGYEQAVAELSDLQTQQPSPAAGNMFELNVPVAESRECKLYDGKAGETFTMFGVSRTNGFTLTRPSNSTGMIVLNLEEKYSAMEFQVAHVTDTDKFDATLSIFIDDAWTQDIEIPFTSHPQTVRIPLDYAHSIRIELSSATMWHPQYGFADVTFYSE